MEHEPTTIPEARGAVAELIEASTREAQGIPAVHHLAPRRTKPGTLDLTAATMFVGDVEKHALICNNARSLRKLIPFRHSKINLGVALEMLRRTLHSLHSLWRQKTVLTHADLQRPGSE